MSEALPAPVPEPAPECETCRKPQALCVCASVAPLDNDLSLLILQHPQEQDRALGTARLAALHFKDAAVVVGLSWPSLNKLLGQPVDPARWAVLYLGSAKAADFKTDRAVVALDRKGEPADDQRAALRDIEGVIVLDGTWSQAKALWWRNAWMLKCRRVILNPSRPSRYGRLRREPRRDGLSTIEAAGMLIAHLENRPDIEAALNASFDRMLAKYREIQATMPELADRARPKRDRRGNKKSR
ncbi:MAG: DTW domain-containing protein [Xanthobacteraceae bacterium]|nr:DTW domain-containing protein [Xanthobacteraceae bacterium]